ncbi:MarR family winged helix-turn-helix transcriptional regulator [Nevskia ramosa]|uniref:MarR family winged helix-turn-helix transcriptional regulator n=1 Tax=Nevskia ramosa TaxID=64002 RepID=UPI002352D332|nr:MarR family transcriptional regulator [Nevskia ramosa]
MQKSVDIVNQTEGQVAETVVESIHSVMHLFRAQQYRVLRDGPHALTTMESKVLGFFSRRIGATLSDLVSHTGRDKGQLARLIGGLRDRGLLEAKADEEDRRNLRLYLTADGAAIHRTLHRQRQRLSGLAVEGLSLLEQQQLLAFLAKVRTNLERAS